MNTTPKTRQDDEQVDSIVIMMFNHYKTIIRNLTWALAASVALIFLSNIAWLIYESQFEVVATAFGDVGQSANVINGSRNSNIKPTAIPD